jgi:trimeric autotransporter adhesin
MESLPGSRSAWGGRARLISRYAMLPLVALGMGACGEGDAVVNDITSILYEIPRMDLCSVKPKLLTPGPFHLHSLGDSVLLIARPEDKTGRFSRLHALHWYSHNSETLSIIPPSGQFLGSTAAGWSGMAAYIQAESNGRGFIIIAVDPKMSLVPEEYYPPSCRPPQVQRLYVPVTVEQVPVALRLTPSPDVTLEQLSEPGAVAVELQDARGNKVVGSWHRYRLSVADTTILRLSGPRVEATWDPRPGGGRDNYWTASFYEGGTISITGLRDGSTYLKAQTVLYDSEGFSTGTLADSILVTVRQGVASVEIDPAGPLTFTSLGEQRALTARARDAGGAPVASAQPTWQSSDPAVVTVDDRGLIRAAAPGSAEIVAEAGGATSPPLQVTVEQRAARVRVTPAEAGRLEALGATLDLSAIVEDAGGSPIPGASVTWQTSNPAVVTVDEVGRVTAIGNGAAVVRASAASSASASGSASGSASAVVSPPVEMVVRQRAANVAITPEGAITLDAEGASATLGVDARDAGGAGITSPEVTWVSSDPEVAAVDGSGRVTAVANGTAAITAQVDGVTSAPVQITVARTGASLAIEPGTPVVLVSLGEESSLTAVIRDAGGAPVAGPSITWQSTNPEVVTVDDAGRIRAITEGSTEIVAMAGTLVSAPLQVTVAQRVVRIVVTPPGPIFFGALGATAQLRAEAQDAGGSPVPRTDIVWRSSSESVATVDVLGRVRAIADGDAIVRAEVGAVRSPGVNILVSQTVATVEVTPPGPLELDLGSVADTGEGRPRLTAVARDARGTAVTEAGPTQWSSSDPNVVAVDAAGVITPVGRGQAQVVATIDGVASGPVAVTVVWRAASIDITPPGPITLTSSGDAIQLTATLRDARGSIIPGPSVAWTSSNPAAVTVDTAGVVTAIVDGTANITATAGEVTSAPVVVTVARAATTVEITPAGSIALDAERESTQLTATVKDGRGALMLNAPVAWTSSNPAVATVSATGLVTAGADGVTTITASSGGAMSNGVSVTVTRTPATIDITPPGPITLTRAEETIQLTATVRDASGNAIPGAPVTWSVSNPAPITVDTAGVVTAMTNGTTMVTARSGDLISPPVEVTVARTPTTVDIIPPGPLTLDEAGQTVQLTATVNDAGGTMMVDAPVTWTSSNPAAATISPTGLVTAVAEGVTTITAASGAALSAGVTVTVDLRLPDLTRVSIAAGLEHTCGLAADGTASCWGGNDLRQVGDNTRDTRLLPVSVATELKFVQIRSGSASTCGLTATGQIYCWGNNQQGQLGIGTSDEGSAIPVLVTSGQVFTALAVMEEHACAIDSDQSAWCWGYNFDGQVGTGFGGLSYTTPQRVAGGHRFVAIADGLALHTCGISTTGQVLCWGPGDSGKLGNGLESPELQPVTVFGGGGLPSFASVAVGAHHTCALSTEGEAYCWGSNTDRALGDGTTSASQSTPTRVATDLRFASITAGDQFTCARTAGGDLYCWGRNADGQLGDGTTTLRSEPTQVAGPHAFREISAGTHFVCGVTTSGDAYCWGRNWAGQLGDGTVTSPRTTPTLVGGGLRFGPP